MDSAIVPSGQKQGFWGGLVKGLKGGQGGNVPTTRVNNRLIDERRFDVHAEPVNTIQTAMLPVQKPSKQGLDALKQHVAQYKTDTGLLKEYHEQQEQLIESALQRIESHVKFQGNVVSEKLPRLVQAQQQADQTKRVYRETMAGRFQSVTGGGSNA